MIKGTHSMAHDGQLVERRLPVEEYETEDVTAAVNSLQR